MQSDQTMGWSRVRLTNAKGMVQLTVFSHFFAFPIEGYFLLTAARTRFFSEGLPCWETRESALRAWEASLRGYEPGPGAFDGIANWDLGIRFRAAAVSLAIIGLGSEELTSYYQALASTNNRCEPEQALSWAAPSCPGT
jgi:hypothetical protein